jgi:hypothetical protein
MSEKPQTCWCEGVSGQNHQCPVHRQDALRARVEALTEEVNKWRDAANAATDQLGRISQEYLNVSARVEALEAERGWQPIETAPKDGSAVWLWNGYRRCIGWYSEYADHSGGWHRQSLIGEPLGKRDIDPETHWMPLPPAPSALTPERTE